MKSIGFTLVFFFFFLNFHLLGLFIPKNKLRAKTKFRLAPGVAVRVLDEIYIDDISAVSWATDLRFRLSFTIWAGLMHLILRILKSLEQIQE
jgi:hypothetical protein